MHYALAMAVLFACTASDAAEWIKYQDEETGHEVWQITSEDAPSQSVYFEMQAFTSDERWLVFSSSRTGSWQLFRASLENGQVTQLTDLPDFGATSFTVHPNGRDAYFLAGWTLRKVEVHTGEGSVVKDFEGVLKSRPGGRPSFSKDGAHAVLSSADGDATLLTLLSIADGQMQTALRWDGRLSHPMISPADHNLISFVPGPDTQNDMSLPMEQRARTWIADARTGTARQFLTMPYGFRATHEVWGPTGERFYFYKKTQPGWVPVSIVSMKADATDWQVHYSHDTLRLGHGDVSDDERWFVSDGQDPGRNPLILISLETGKAETLAWPNASITGGHAAQAHVHPSFSPSGRFITYTSDRTGTPQVYVVPVPEEVRQRLSTLEQSE